MRRIDGHLLWLGNVRDARDSRALLAADIFAVVDLAGNETPAALPRELVYCRFPLVDGGENPAWLLRAAAGTVALLLKAQTSVIVCCGAGMSRSPAIAAAGVSLALNCPLNDALVQVSRGGAVDVSPVLWQTIAAAMA